ncbi:MAG: cysteine--tRNA ligase [Acidobacteriota bacterium]
MREIRFYNTLGRALETFVPQKEGAASVYTCGPTVYNHAHIGNLRTFVFEDFLCRSLRYLGFDVMQVMNLTDVDDKTIERANAAGLGLNDFTATFIESFFEDLDTLQVEKADKFPRATEHVPEMIELIEQLIERGYAYESDGSVYFRIKADEDYGRLSGIDPEGGLRGERVASDEYTKEDARDFGLWKAAKEGEPFWDSPWGRGRPGWHIECSAMSMKYLGESFDIHCGGVDNIFPHHENEIAQSESVTGKEFVHTWLHSEHLMVDGAKMSKSLGNQYTLKELLERGMSPRAIRYVFIAAHYRQKLNFTFDSVAAAEAALARVDEMRFRLESATEEGEPRQEVAAALARLQEDFAAALANDLNASAALSAVFQLVKEINKAIERGRLGIGDRQRVVAALADVDQVLAVLDPGDWQGSESPAEGGLSDERIEDLLAERRTARQQRDFATADRIRDELQSEGISIEDTPDGTRWRRK